MFVRCTYLCVRVFVVVCIREMYMVGYMRVRGNCIREMYILVCTLVASVRCTYLDICMFVVVCIFMSVHLSMCVQSSMCIL